MKKTHSDKLLDSMIKHAGYTIFTEAADTAPIEETTPDILGGLGELDERMAKILGKESAKRRAHEIRNTMLRIVAMLAVIIVVTSISIMSSEALRLRIINLFIAESGASAQVWAENENDSGLPEDMIVPEYLPEGFKLIDASCSGTMIYSKYMDEEGDYIFIEQDEIGVVMTIDTEHYTYYETEIKDYQALVFEGGKDNKLVLYTDVWCLTIFGTVEIEEIIKIAENLQLY